MSLAPDEVVRLVSDRRVADRLVKDPRVVHVSRLVDSFGWLSTLFAILLWSWLFRWLMRRFFLNPWTTLVFVLKVRTPRDADNDLQADGPVPNTPAASHPTPSERT